VLGVDGKAFGESLGKKQDSKEHDEKYGSLKETIQNLKTGQKLENFGCGKTLCHCAYALLG